MSLDELDTGGNLINLSRYCGMFRSPLLFRVCNYPNAQRLFYVSSDRELILDIVKGRDARIKYDPTIALIFFNLFL